MATSLRPFFHEVVKSPVGIFPLVTFRILFGLLMAASLIRFWAKGWIAQFYILPPFHFKYLGFEWVHSLGNPGMYILFAVAILAAFGISFGLLYRWSASIFFLAFTYIELIDKTTYLNHYYFISLVAFIMIFVPANRLFSLDVKFNWVEATTRVPALYLNVIKFQIGAVYFFAGIAKLNYDWLILAQPLTIWLSSLRHLQVIGEFLTYKWVHYAASWFGAIYDLIIPFLLLYGRTRSIAFLLVLFFHLATALFFQIGMFPYIMILSTLVFFSQHFHRHLLGFLGLQIHSVGALKTIRISPWLSGFFAVFVLVQLLLPFRYLWYPGNVYWHEQGYRFSWRVMLMEKSGLAQFKVMDEEGKIYWVENSHHLTREQEKQLGTQPDFILQFAHFLAEYYSQQGVESPRVYADVYVTLNGRPSKPLIKNDVDLSKLPYNLSHRSWVLEEADSNLASNSKQL